MNPDQQRDLLKRLQGLERQHVRVRIGVITDDTPLSVTLGDSDIPYTDVAAAGAGAALAVDDVVAVLTFGHDLLVLGRVTDDGDGGGSVGVPSSEGVPVYVQQTDPAVTPPYVWHEVDGSGNLITTWVNA